MWKCSFFFFWQLHLWQKRTANLGIWTRSMVMFSCLSWILTSLHSLIHITEVCMASPWYSLPFSSSSMLWKLWSKIKSQEKLHNYVNVQVNNWLPLIQQPQIKNPPKALLNTQRLKLNKLYTDWDVQPNKHTSNKKKRKNKRFVSASYWRLVMRASLFENQEVVALNTQNAS